jgi:hypothetical protein
LVLRQTRTTQPPGCARTRLQLRTFLTPLVSVGWPYAEAREDETNTMQAVLYHTPSYPNNLMSNTGQNLSATGRSFYVERIEYGLGYSAVLRNGSSQIANTMQTQHYQTQPHQTPSNQTSFYQNYPPPETCQSLSAARRSRYAEAREGGPHTMHTVSYHTLSYPDSLLSNTGQILSAAGRPPPTSAREGGPNTMQPLTYQPPSQNHSTPEMRQIPSAPTGPPPISAREGTPDTATEERVRRYTAMVRAQAQRAQARGNQRFIAREYSEFSSLMLVDEVFGELME